MSDVALLDDLVHLIDLIDYVNTWSDRHPEVFEPGESRDLFCDLNSAGRILMGAYQRAGARLLADPAPV